MSQLQTTPARKVARLSGMPYSPTNPNYGQQRVPLLYCGKRLLPENYLPVGDANLSRLYDHNKYPSIPYTEEIAAVIAELEEQLSVEYERDEIDRHRSPTSPTPGAGTPTRNSTPSRRNASSLLKRKRRVHVAASYDQIVDALEARGVNIDDYLVENVARLSQEHADHVKAFCKNRMMVAFVWSNQFKDALVRDALGIDKDHNAFSIAFDICTDQRSSLQAKILGRGHIHGVAYNSSANGLVNYTLKHVQKQPTYENASGRTMARLPNSNDFPQHYRSIEMVIDVFADVADAVDWDACYKGNKSGSGKPGNKEKGPNHLGRAAILRTITVIQAECLNALQNGWTNRKGVYSRPQNRLTQKKDKFTRHKAVLDTVRATDTTAAPIIPNPVEVKLREDLAAAGLPCPNGPIQQVLCLYPLPRYLTTGKVRRRNVGQDATSYAENDALLLFGDATMSELEDNGEDDEEDEEVEDEEE
ncbi:hypothetical protein BJ508DRAFT_301158 [Ascobolus immersus RN42]|uniref:Uncharacterized protein n=1 Tax=Ascobolus immersus RN42 TaxID=1160509 RepID=A0A3N4IMV1_ASCIM|nr:hypothetical protein BJ508DRAFT_301158 [Ascobolus immersus RN42]